MKTVENKVIVKAKELPTMTEGGLHLVTICADTRRGEVVSEGELYGETIIFSNYGSVEIVVNNEKYLVILKDNILAMI